MCYSKGSLAQTATEWHDYAEKMESDKEMWEKAAWKWYNTAIELDKELAGLKSQTPTAEARRKMNHERFVVALYQLGSIDVTDIDKEFRLDLAKVMDELSSMQDESDGRKTVRD
jgi:hypothetical protein